MPGNSEPAIRGTDTQNGLSHVKKSDLANMLNGWEKN